jgi:hypothetical protein
MAFQFVIMTFQFIKMVFQFPKIVFQFPKISIRKVSNFSRLFPIFQDCFQFFKIVFQFFKCAKKINSPGPINCPLQVLDPSLAPGNFLNFFLGLKKRKVKQRGVHKLDQSNFLLTGLPPLSGVVGEYWFLSKC